MDAATKRREKKQFKVLMWLCGCLYPVWLAYGVWAGSYDAPISVGFVFIWGFWNIRRVKKQVENVGGARLIDWHEESIDKQTNMQILVASLLLTVIAGMVTLYTLHFLFG